MLVVRALYGLKSSISAFRYLLGENFHDLGYRPSITETDIWMIPEVKPGGFIYYEYVLSYKDGVI